MTQEAGQWIRQALGREAPAEEFHQARWCPPLQRPCPRWRHPPPLGPGRGRQVKGGTPLWDGRRARPPGGNGPFCSGLRTQGSADVPRTPWGRAWMVVATAFPPPLRCRSSAWKSSLTGGGSQVRRCGDHTGRETTQAPPSAADASTGPAGRANDRLHSFAASPRIKCTSRGRRPDPKSWYNTVQVRTLARGRARRRLRPFLCRGRVTDPERRQ